MTGAPKIGVMGGTFDPIHRGHLDAAVAAGRALALNRILLFPSGHPPHRTVGPRASHFHRFAMVALAILPYDRFQVSDLELQSPGPSYTVDTLDRLSSAGLDPRQLFFITGADAFAEIASWKDYPDVLNRSHFVVVSRPGSPVTSLRRLLPQLSDRMLTIPQDRLAAAGQQAEAVTLTELNRSSILLLDVPTTDVSSTEIRRRILAHEPLDGLVPPEVETYIRRHSLYSSD